MSAVEFEFISQKMAKIIPYLRSLLCASLLDKLSIQFKGKVWTLSKAQTQNSKLKSVSVVSCTPPPPHHPFHPLVWELGIWGIKIRGQPARSKPVSVFHKTETLSWESHQGAPSVWHFVDFRPNRRGARLDGLEWSVSRGNQTRGAAEIRWTCWS